MKSVARPAIYRNVRGTAQLLNGSGYLFRAAGERQATLVSYRDADLSFAAGSPAPAAAPTPDDRPLWMQIADPGYYEGTDKRGTLVRGRY